MKTSATVLVLLAFLTLVPCTQCMAQAPVGAPLGSVTAAGTAPAGDTAAFLASLSGGPGKTPGDLTPAPSFMTGCTSDDQCPAGQICCYACGQPDCGMACFVPWRKNMCPPFV
jgi:hypothetical protein